MKTHKKGQATGTLASLAGVAVLFVILAVTFSIGGDIVSDLHEDSCTTFWNTTSLSCQSSATDSQANATSGHNITGFGVGGLNKMTTKLGILATIVMAGVFITLISRAFSA